MARRFAELGDHENAGQASLVLMSSGGLFLLWLIGMSLLIISVVIFACADHNSGSHARRRVKIFAMEAFVGLAALLEAQYPYR